MKLLARINMYYILFSLLAFALGGFIFYYVIRNNIYDEVDDSMRLEKDRVIQKIMTTDTVPRFFSSFENQVSIKIVDNNEQPYLRFSDTLICDSISNDYTPFRHLESLNKIYTKSYKIYIAKSLIKKSDLIKSIFLLMFFLSGSLYLVLFSVNYFVSKSVWVPFSDTINKLKNYKLTRDSKLELSKTSITEFKQLNSVIKLMSDKIQQDFISLREFTENASHEIQTPLAIIKSKLELLIQSDNLNESQIKQIQAIYSATGRLSKLNQFLLLITKIENLQFSKTSEIDLCQITDKFLNEFEEIISLKQLKIEKHYSISKKLNFNPTLSGILISNLISNAIKHNIDNGLLKIEINNNEFKITNSGEVLNKNPEELFERFKKAKIDSESLGIGLSIVKKISEIYNIKPEYTYFNGFHTLSLKF